VPSSNKFSEVAASTWWKPAATASLAPRLSDMGSPWWSSWREARRAVGGGGPVATGEARPGDLLESDDHGALHRKGTAGGRAPAV
jgi:hypothetical protein